MRTRWLTGIFLAVGLLTLSGCVYRAGSTKFYGVTSQLPQGQKAIAENEIRYACEGVWDLWGADLRRGSDCYYVFLKGSDWYKLDSNYTGQMQLHPRFSFWNDWGIWMAVPLLIALTMMMVLLGWFWS